MNRRLLLMSATAAVLGAYVMLGEGGFLSHLFQPADQAAPEGTAKTAPSSAGKPRDGIKLNPLQGLDPQSFAAIVEQPLFNPGRLPRPVEPPPPPETEAVPAPEPVAENNGPLPEDYRLLAVSSGPAGRIAALRLNQTNEVVFLHEGQDVQSWKVLAVNPRSIVIGTPEQNIELGMFENNGDVPAAPGDADQEDPGQKQPPEGEAPADSEAPPESEN